MLDRWLKKQLEQRRSTDLLRRLQLREGLVDFVSNDYLGFAHSPELSFNITSTLDRNNIKLNGATGSRLLSGNSQYVEQVESKLAALFQGEAALIFNSGYAANQAVLSSIPQRGDTIFYDELVHSCIKDGARLSLAKRLSFKHNDLNDLENKLSKAEGKIFIAVESIYSMDGDACPLVDLVAIAEKHNANVVLDEAHSTGAYGERGSGLATQLGVHQRIPLRVYTFGKAMGVHGACIVGSEAVKQYLINFARPFIYTTALPPHSVASIECAFDFLNENIELQDVLRKKISLFLSATTGLTNRVQSNSSIQTAIYPGNNAVRKASAILQQKGFDVRPILSPTVRVGKERLRICLHVYNSDEEIKNLSEALKALNQA